MGACLAKEGKENEEVPQLNRQCEQDTNLKVFDRNRFQNQQQQQMCVMTALSNRYSAKLTPSKVRSITGPSASPPGGAIIQQNPHQAVEYKTICFSPEKENSHCLVYPPNKSGRGTARSRRHIKDPSDHRQ